MISRIFGRVKRVFGGPTATRPIRDVRLSADELEVDAERMAMRHEVFAAAPRGPSLRDAARSDFRRLRELHDRFSRAVTVGEPVNVAAEWLLDNFHIIEAQARAIDRNLSRGFLAELPRLVNEERRGMVRIYEVALELIAHTDAHIDEDDVVRYIEAYQRVEPLTTGELWAAPIMLQLGLLGNLRRLCEREYANHEQTVEANRWVDHTLTRLSDDPDDHADPALLGEIVPRNIERRDPAYIATLLQRLQSAPSIAQPLLDWTRERLSRRGQDIDRLIAISNRRQAASRVSIASSITSMRTLAAMDWRDSVERLSVVERELRRDPAGIYERCDFDTRDQYRHVVERIARWARVAEQHIAATAVELAEQATSDEPDARSGHVGYYLVDDGVDVLEDAVGSSAGRRRQLERLLWRRRGMVAFTIAALIALAIVIGLVMLTRPGAQTDTLIGALALAFLTAVLSVIAASEIALSIVHRVTSMFVTPRLLPKLDLRDGVPEDLRTAVVIQGLLSNERDALDVLDRAEVYALANHQENLVFGVLADFGDADRETLESDAAIIDVATTRVRELNEQYTGSGRIRFFFMCRVRTWNEAEGVWMGYERKRGKLMAFNQLLRGTSADEAGFAHRTCDPEDLGRVRYVITLDSDTQLPRDAAIKLIGAMAHPLNAPVHDAQTNVVVKGYAVLQPRIGLSLADTSRSPFTRVFSHQAGLDPYTRAVSDFYQDMFERGIYTGKGIYDIDAFERALDDAIPEQTVLSHDLLEGSYARAGLVSDVEFIDGFTSTYGAYMARAHRWIRGDWQLLQWLKPRMRNARGEEVVNPLSKLARWKMLDNLRRSLLAPALVMLMLLGLSVLPGPPLLWLAFVAITLALPVSTAVAEAMLAARPTDVPFRARMANWAENLARTTYETALFIVFLPHSAYVSIHAVCITLWRMVVTHRRMLEWVTAAAAEKRMKNDLRFAYAKMWACPAVGAALIAGVWIIDPAPWPSISGILMPIAVVLGIVWTAAPAVAFVISRPHDRQHETLTDADRTELHRIARQTWQYFEEFAGEAYNWLPADNHQLEPDVRTAHRTSPTNIGMLLTSAIGAYDLGIVSLPSLVTRLERTFDTVTKLERTPSGHFFNWYDILTLKPLAPMYLSTVDSGNLVGALIVVARAMDQFATLDDASLQAALHAGDDADGGATDDPELRNVNRDALRDRCRALHDIADRLAQRTDFSVLFDKRRKLFSIGFNSEAGALDPSHYDLLASEVRLASFIAIAYGQVPVEHWFRLGRALTARRGVRALVSWSGTMFEYLMPNLFNRVYEGTLLHESCVGAVRRQIAFGAAHRTPWGVSESAYSALHPNRDYHYKAHGVPGLGLKRQIAEDVVIAPYATALALRIDPHRAMDNLRHLIRDGAGGTYGLYEAIDYTPERLPRGEKRAVVAAYMAHHQGMILTAIANALTENAIVERFHSAPAIRATDILLQERAPRHVALAEPHPTEVSAAGRIDSTVPSDTRAIDEPYPDAMTGCLLGNGAYHVFLTSAGSGFSRIGDVAVNRWREDATCEVRGQFIYLRDVDRGVHWSAAAAPIGGKPQRYRAIFSTHKAEFSRQDGPIETHTDIAVHPEHNAEVRIVRLTNHGDDPVSLDVTSAMEIALASHRADIDHPAFGNLFLQTEAVPGGLLCRRRPRSEGESPPWLFHIAAVEHDPDVQVEVESDRSRFLGRDRGFDQPIAVTSGAGLSGRTGAVLDPVFSARVRVTVPAYGSARLAFVTGAAATREEAEHLARDYRDYRAAWRAHELAWTHAQIESRSTAITSERVLRYHELAAQLLVPHPLRRKRAQDIAANRRGQSALWPYSISGDWPIMLIRIVDDRQQNLVKFALQAHQHLRNRGLKFDLVFLNEHHSSYRTDVTDKVRDLMRAYHRHDLEGRPGGVFVREADTMPHEDAALLRAVARVVLASESELTVSPSTARPMPALKPQRPPVTVEPPAPPRGELASFNGYGGFTQDAREYIVRLDGDRTTPAPWLNVIANPRFGFLVSATGAGYTWAINSRENKLTSWSNDPVTDPPAECVYIRDDETGEFWSPTPSPVRRRWHYSARHGQGYSVFHHHCSQLLQEMWLFVPMNDPVKIVRLQLKNESSAPRTLSVYYYAELALGSSRDAVQSQTVTHSDPELDVLFARNRYSVEFGERVAFLEGVGGERTYTGDRAEFIGRGRTVRNPAALRRTRLSGRVGAGHDPCAAVQLRVQLEPGESKTVTFLFGQGDDVRHARSLVATYRNPARVQQALQHVWDDWNQKLDMVKVNTPSQSMNLALNRWLLYQSIVCRMWARTALYQSGGAYGYRDQLQDGASLLYGAPHLTREHLLRAAGRMFEQGDAQHWWHEPAGRGVRTRCSDDYLWLPWAVADYVRKIGDTGVLDERVDYLHDEPLRDDEHDRYNAPTNAGRPGSLYEHCIRALDRGLSMIGAHSLPLMGDGDWNDGMSNVGADGRGESVWLAWFLARTLRDFAPICEDQGDAETAARYLAGAQQLVDAVDEHAWDGAWYQRAFTDDGRALGSHVNDECRIDSIAQSWSIICGLGDRDRAQQAVKAAREHLVRDDDQLILLLTPPFDTSSLNPGYIKGYLPGVRENGGQYTHAACWLVLAHALLGRGDEAARLWEMINPVNHGATQRDAERYVVEPYVVAADVYGVEPHVGRGGWTWYTGSAGWLYRVAIESILGLTLLGGRFRVDPCIPSHWDRFTMTYRHYSSRYVIEVENPSRISRGIKRIELDGKPLPHDWNGEVHMVDDGREHRVRVVMGEQTPTRQVAGPAKAT